MKKVFAILLAMMLVLSMGTAAMAEGEEGKEAPTYSDAQTATFTKVYDATNTGTTSPKEIFNFTIERISVSDAAAGVTAENMPIPTMGTVSYEAGEAGGEKKSKTVTITLPSYTSVGIYTYTIKETAGKTAGVEYYGKDIRLKVTVIEQDGKVRVAAVHTEDGFNGSGDGKLSSITNTYSAGSLVVKKSVTGNLGDKSKDFDVTVTFRAPEGKTVGEAISYTDGTENKTIATTDWTNGTATAKITLKHDETVAFTNIPYDVTYTVVEDEYTSDGYDPATYNFSDTNKKIDSASDTVQITNNKGATIDTGITTDSLPYILLMAFVMLSGAVLLLKRRNAYND